MPKFVSYVRVSSDQQKQSGLGEEAALARTKAWIALQLTSDKYAGYQVGPILQEDEGVSGAVPLFKRKKGRLLKDLLGPGDVLAVAVHDRSFRNTKDALEVKEYFDERGVAMHFCNLNIDLSTKEGELIFTIMVAASQWERRSTSDRMKAIYALKRARGESCNKPGVEWKKVKGRAPNGEKRIWKFARMEVVRIIRFVRYLYDVKGYKFHKISDRVEQILARDEKRPMRPEKERSFRKGEATRPYSWSTLRNMYKRSARVLAEVKAQRRDMRQRAKAHKAKLAARAAQQAATEAAS